jgi:hypothetical protein
MKDQAYANAHLRAAAQAFHAEDYAPAQEALIQAITLNPSLTMDGGSRLADIFVAWIDLPKISDPIQHLENIFTHLPHVLDDLSRQRAKILGKVAAQHGFEAYQRGDRSQAKKSMLKAIRYWPFWLANKGVISILLKPGN